MSRSRRFLPATTCRARVWERGVGLTLACGSAACATLVAAARLELMDRKGTVRLPGGDLIIEWRGSDDHVLMTGPVEYEGAFILDEALFEAARRERWRALTPTPLPKARRRRASFDALWGEGARQRTTLSLRGKGPEGPMRARWATPP